VEHDEAELISRCQRGDQDALKEIFNQYHKKIYRVAYGVVRQREDALILFRKFLSSSSAPSKILRENPFFDLSLSHGNQHAIDHLRKAGNPISQALTRKRGSTRFRTENRPDRIFFYRSWEGKVNEALDKLPVDQRTAIILRKSKAYLTRK